MNREDLYEAAGHIDEDILARSEGPRRPRRGRWLGVAAAVVALAVVGGVLLWPGGSPLVTTAYAVREAAYPETVAYPNEADYLDPATGVLDDAFSEAYDAWWASRQARQQPAGYADSLAAFWEKCLPALLGGQAGENAVCSPLNLYLALGMLAELTAGDTRQQILDLLGAESLEALRTQARQVWQGHYWQDGISASTLASSLWLEEGVPFREEPLDTLAEAYYASTYQADLGSEEGNQALQTWLRDQTGGLLEDQAGSVTLSPDTLLALAATLYFQDRWAQEFPKSTTQPGTFHALAGDQTCDFLRSDWTETYYWADHFAAVGKDLVSGGTMWFLLPDEGVAAEDLLTDPQTAAFLQAGGAWENQRDLVVHLAIPKFDLSARTDLTQGLREMGVTQVLDPGEADFSPLTEEPLWLGQARQDVRVAIDEEGVTAAAYTVMAMEGATAPPEEEVDFVLDRPFLFAVTSQDGLPLFVGIVHQPG